MARSRIYIRRSDEDQSGYSPEAQDRESRRWCDQHGHEVVEVYTDDDMSGKREDRTRFQQLLKDAKADPGSVVVVHKFDRLARDTETILRIVYKELKPRGVKVYSVLEDFDIYTPHGKAMLSVSATFSTYYVDNLSTDVSKGYRAKFARGGWIGPLPLGYESKFDLDGKGERIKGTSRAVFSADADTARLIFQLYATGNHSDLSLAEEMNTRGLTMIHKGKRVPFQKDGIGGVLTNPFYIGMVTYKGEQTRGAHELLIDRGLWDRVQEIRAARAPHKGGGRARFHDPDGLLLEVAYCGKCGARLHWNKGDKADGRYWCSRRRNYGVTACDAPLIPASPIERQVLDVLRTLTIPPVLRDAVIQVVADRLTRSATPQTIDITDLEAQLSRLKDLYQLGHLERHEYLQKRAKLERKLAQAAPLPTRSIDIEPAMNFLGDLPMLLDAAVNAQRRALIRQLVQKIWIEKNAVTAIKPAANFLLLVQALAGINGDLGGARTHNLQLRRLTLYPIELRGHRRWGEQLPTRPWVVGRGEWIRTTDLSDPNAALYQAEPRPGSDLCDPCDGWCRRWESNPHEVSPSGF
jgi:site-specific DNA recombinase